MKSLFFVFWRLISGILSHSQVLFLQICVTHSYPTVGNGYSMIGVNHSSAQRQNELIVSELILCVHAWLQLPDEQSFQYTQLERVLHSCRQYNGVLIDLILVNSTFHQMLSHRSITLWFMLSYAIRKMSASFSDIARVTAWTFYFVYNITFQHFRHSWFQWWKSRFDFLYCQHYLPMTLRLKNLQNSVISSLHLGCLK